MSAKSYALHLSLRRAGGDADDYDPVELVEKMFAGKKAGLRPIYDRL